MTCTQSYGALGRAIKLLKGESGLHDGIHFLIEHTESSLFRKLDRFENFDFETNPQNFKAVLFNQKQLISHLKAFSLIIVETANLQSYQVSFIQKLIEICLKYLANFFPAYVAPLNESLGNFLNSLPIMNYNKLIFRNLFIGVAQAMSKKCCPGKIERDELYITFYLNILKVKLSEDKKLIALEVLLSEIQTTFKNSLFDEGNVEDLERSGRSENSKNVFYQVCLFNEVLLSAVNDTKDKETINQVMSIFFTLVEKLASYPSNPMTLLSITSILQISETISLNFESVQKLNSLFFVVERIREKYLHLYDLFAQFSVLVYRANINVGNSSCFDVNKLINEIDIRKIKNLQVFEMMVDLIQTSAKTGALSRDSLKVVFNITENLSIQFSKSEKINEDCSEDSFIFFKYRNYKKDPDSVFDKLISLMSKFISAESTESDDTWIKSYKPKETSLTLNFKGFNLLVPLNTFLIDSDQLKDLNQNSKFLNYSSILLRYKLQSLELSKNPFEINSVVIYLLDFLSKVKCSTTEALYYLKEILFTSQCNVKQIYLSNLQLLNELLIDCYNKCTQNGNDQFLTFFNEIFSTVVNKDSMLSEIVENDLISIILLNNSLEKELSQNEVLLSRSIIEKSKGFDLETLLRIFELTIKIIDQNNLTEILISDLKNIFVHLVQNGAIKSTIALNSLNSKIKSIIRNKFSSFVKNFQFYKNIVFVLFDEFELETTDKENYAQYNILNLIFDKSRSNVKDQRLESLMQINIAELDLSFLLVILDTIDTGHLLKIFHCKNTVTAFLKRIFTDLISNRQTTIFLSVVNKLHSEEAGDDLRQNIDTSLTFLFRENYRKLLEDKRVDELSNSIEILSVLFRDFCNIRHTPKFCLSFCEDLYNYLQVGLTTSIINYDLLIKILRLAEFLLSIEIMSYGFFNFHLSSESKVSDIKILFYKNLKNIRIKILEEFINKFILQSLYLGKISSLLEILGEIKTQQINLVFDKIDFSNDSELQDSFKYIHINELCQIIISLRINNYTFNDNSLQWIRTKLLERIASEDLNIPLVINMINTISDEKLVDEIFKRIVDFNIAVNRWMTKGYILTLKSASTTPVEEFTYQLLKTMECFENPRILLLLNPYVSKIPASLRSHVARFLVEMIQKSKSLIHFESFIFEFINNAMSKSTRSNGDSNYLIKMTKFFVVPILSQFSLSKNYTSILQLLVRLIYSLANEKFKLLTNAFEALDFSYVLNILVTCLATTVVNHDKIFISSIFQKSINEKNNSPISLKDFLINTSKVIREGYKIKKFSIEIKNDNSFPITENRFLNSVTRLCNNVYILILNLLLQTHSEVNQIINACIYVEHSKGVDSLISLVLDSDFKFATLPVLTQFTSVVLPNYSHAIDETFVMTTQLYQCQEMKTNESFEEFSQIIPSDNTQERKIEMDYINKHPIMLTFIHTIQTLKLKSNALSSISNVLLKVYVEIDSLSLRMFIVKLLVNCYDELESNKCVLSRILLEYIANEESVGPGLNYLYRDALSLFLKWNECTDEFAISQNEIDLYQRALKRIVSKVGDEILIVLKSNLELLDRFLMLIKSSGNSLFKFDSSLVIRLLKTPGDGRTSVIWRAVGIHILKFCLHHSIRPFSEVLESRPDNDAKQPETNFVSKQDSFDAIIFDRNKNRMEIEENTNSLDELSQSMENIMRVLLKNISTTYNKELGSVLSKLLASKKMFFRSERCLDGKSQVILNAFSRPSAKFLNFLEEIVVCNPEIIFESKQLRVLFLDKKHFNGDKCLSSVVRIVRSIIDNSNYSSNYKNDLVLNLVDLMIINTRFFSISVIDNICSLLLEFDNQQIRDMGSSVAELLKLIWNKSEKIIVNYCGNEFSSVTKKLILIFLSTSDHKTLSRLFVLYCISFEITQESDFKEIINLVINAQESPGSLFNLLKLSLYPAEVLIKSWLVSVIHLIDNIDSFETISNISTVQREEVEEESFGYDNLLELSEINSIFSQDETQALSQSPVLNKERFTYNKLFLRFNKENLNYMPNRILKQYRGPSITYSNRKRVLKPYSFKNSMIELVLGSTLFSLSAFINVFNALYKQSSFYEKQNLESLLETAKESVVNKAECKSFVLKNLSRNFKALNTLPSSLITTLSNFSDCLSFNLIIEESVLYNLNKQRRVDNRSKNNLEKHLLTSIHRETESCDFELEKKIISLSNYLSLVDYNSSIVPLFEPLMIDKSMYSQFYFANLNNNYRTILLILEQINQENNLPYLDSLVDKEKQKCLMGIGMWSDLLMVWIKRNSDNISIMQNGNIVITSLVKLTMHDQQLLVSTLLLEPSRWENFKEIALQLLSKSEERANLIYNFPFELCILSLISNDIERLKYFIALFREKIILGLRNRDSNSHLVSESQNYSLLSDFLLFVCDQNKVISKEEVEKYLCLVIQSVNSDNLISQEIILLMKKLVLSNLKELTIENEDINNIISEKEITVVLTNVEWLVSNNYNELAEMKLKHLMNSCDSLFQRGDDSINFIALYISIRRNTLEREFNFEKYTNVLNMIKCIISNTNEGVSLMKLELMRNELVIQFWERQDCKEYSEIIEVIKSSISLIQENRSIDNAQKINILENCSVISMKLIRIQIEYSLIPNESEFDLLIKLYVTSIFLLVSLGRKQYNHCFPFLFNLFEKYNAVVGRVFEKNYKSLSVENWLPWIDNIMQLYNRQIDFGLREIIYLLIEHSPERVSAVLIVNGLDSIAPEFRKSTLLLQYFIFYENLLYLEDPELKIKSEIEKLDLSKSDPIKFLLDKINILNEKYRNSEFLSESEVYPVFINCSKEIIQKLLQLRESCKFDESGFIKLELNKIVQNINIVIKKRYSFNKNNSLSYYNTYFKDSGNFKDVKLSIGSKSRSYSVLKFENKIKSYESLRHPKLIKLYCSDGVIREVLFKCGEDLREDQRIMKLFSIFQSLLVFNGIECNIKTYEIIPLSFNAGLIEFVSDSTSLKNILAEKSSLDSSAIFRKRFMESKGNDTIGRHLELWNMDDLAIIQQYDKEVEFANEINLKNYLLENSKSTDDFVSTRRSFLKDYAYLAYFGYILGIGDRHMDNILINNRNEVFYIDFGCSFNTGLYLPVPELIPFRLTPNILTLGFPLGINGVFQETIGKAFKIINKVKDIIMDYMKIYTKDPIDNWKVLADKFECVEISEANQVTNIDKLIEQRLDVVFRKLSGHSPYEILIAQLESMNLSKQVARDSILNKIMKYHDELRKEQGALDSVQELIYLASDKRLLGRAWSGWAAYL